MKPAAGDVDAEWTHDLHALNNPTAGKTTKLPPRGPKAARTARVDQLQRGLNGGSVSSQAPNSQFNVVAPSASTPGMSIRGLAGPYIVLAKNFAHGTTAADIESAVTPIGGVTLSCRIIAHRPQVIAEIIFESKEGADAVVDTFNNQMVSSWKSGNRLGSTDSKGTGRWPSVACISQNRECSINSSTFEYHIRLSRE